jgi:hypothetical protein
MMRANYNTWPAMFRQQLCRNTVAIALLLSIAIQAFGFFIVPQQSRDDASLFEVCTASGMVMMHETTDTPTDQHHDPARFQCTFCVMAHSIATPAFALIVFMFALVQTDRFTPFTYTFVLPDLAKWTQLPARAPPSSLL